MPELPVAMQELLLNRGNLALRENYEAHVAYTQDAARRNDFYRLTVIIEETQRLRYLVMTQQQ